MRKYQNVMRNTIVLRNGIKIPAGHIVELPEELAAQAGSGLRPIDRPAPPQPKAGLSKEDRDKLDKVSRLLESFPEMIEQLTKNMPQQVVIHQTGGEVTTHRRNDEPIPVILDKFEEVESNIAEATDESEHGVDAFKDKLAKIRKMKGE